MTFSKAELNFLISSIDRCTYSNTRDLRHKSLMLLKLCAMLEEQSSGDLMEAHSLYDAPELANGSGKEAVSED